MEITRHPSSTGLVLALKGRLDGAWSERTSEALTATLEEGQHHLRLDLSGVTFLSSAGIRTLMIHYKRLAELKGRLTVIHPSAPVREVLELAGLTSLLAEPSTPDGTSASAGRDFSGGSVTAFPLHADASPGASLLSPGAPVCFTQESFGLGLGALGREPGSVPGEFLALGGMAIVQPADNRQGLDYLMTQGSLQPQVTPLSGIVAHGPFAQCLRFEGSDPRRGLPLTDLLELALRETASDTIGLAFAAETEFLVGAALLQPPGESLALASFPQIRDQMLFTVEPAYPRSLTLGVAFATRSADHPLGLQLRPAASLQVHAHAAAFSYRPLPKGQLDLPTCTAELLDHENPLGLLHLLDDHRPGGLGQSRFHRGALWVTPL